MVVETVKSTQADATTALLRDSAPNLGTCTNHVAPRDHPTLINSD
jgi:hypothetical protein